MLRIPYIDIAKGIGIFLVVLAHTQGPQIMKLVIYSFHMPLFFFLAGYTFNFKKYSNKTIWINKIDRLLLPYFFSCIVFFCYWFYVEKTLSTVSSTSVFLGIFIGNIHNLEVNAVLWFLIALFSSEIIFFYFLSFMRHIKILLQLAMVLTLGLAGYFISKLQILPWGLDVALVAQVFLFIGYQMKRKEVLNKKITTWSLVFYVSFLLLFTIGAYFNGKVDMGSRNYNNIILFYMNGLSGSILILSLSKIIRDTYARVLSVLGERSLVIMVLHIHCFKIINLMGISIRHWVLFTLIGIIIPIILNRPFQKILNTISRQVRSIQIY